MSHWTYQSPLLTTTFSFPHSAGTSHISICLSPCNSGSKAFGNGLAGVTIHNHAIPGPPSDTNGNVIVGNVLSRDGLDGCGTGSPGDCEFGDTHTTGILVGSDSTPITGTVIAGNVISNVYYGIFTQNVPTTIPVSANSYHMVAVPVFQH